MRSGPRRSSGAGKQGDPRSRCRRADRRHRRISPSVHRLPSLPLSAPCENIQTMTRIYLMLLMAVPFLSAVPASALPRVERGNLIFDNIPEPAAGLSEKLDSYLNARQAAPLRFSPKGQLPIPPRFVYVDHVHLRAPPGIRSIGRRMTASCWF